MKKKSLLLTIMKTGFMQLSFAILLAGTAIARDGKAQALQETVTLNETKKLTEILSSLEKKTSVKFIYSPALIHSDRKVTLSVTDQSLQLTLNQLLQPLKITYEASGNTVVLKSNPELLSLETTKDLNRSLAIIRGKVTDSKGEPLIGVSVKVKGATIGVSTDINGAFSLDVVDTNPTLIFTYIGYISKEVVVTNNTLPTVILEENANDLEEVVVVGYGTQKKATLTGSVTSIKTEALTVSPASTLSMAMAGKAPGIMSRTIDGRPGNAAIIQIRNFGSPLFIIDGAQSTETEFNNLDANNIEDLSILKDAAAAIYGIQASNGVILVTTKRGKPNSKNAINFQSYYGMQSWNRFAQPADAGTFVFAKATAQVNNTMAGSGTGATAYTPDILNKWAAGTEPGFIGTNWYDEVVDRNVPQVYYNLSTSGGSDKINYFLSFSKMDQDGTFKDYNYNRYNVQSNIEAKVLNSLTIGGKLAASIDNTSSPSPAGGEPNWQQLYGLYRNYPTWQMYANDNPLYPNHTEWDETQHAIFRKDIVGSVENINRNASANLYANYQTPLKGLTARFQYTYRLRRGENDRIQRTFNTYTYNAATDQYNVTGGIQTGSHLLATTQILNNSYQAQLNFGRTFGKHNVSGTYVFAADDEVSTGLSITSRPSSNYLDLITFAELTASTNTWNTFARMGHVGRFNYAYDGKYLFEVAGRYDGSWKFPPGKRWGLFPSTSAGWVISKENFFAKSGIGKIVNNLKIRGGYGVLGNDTPGNYNAFDYIDGYNYNSGSQVFDGKIIIGTQSRNPGVNNISWAEATVANLGLDVSILNGKFEGEFDVFRRDVTGLSARRNDVLIPNEISVILPYENLNSERDQGIEGVIRHNGRAGAFNYSVSLISTYSRRKTLETYNPRFGNSWDLYRNGTVDRYQGVTWLYDVIGQFQSMEQINNYPVNIDNQGNRTLLPGDFIYRDFNNDGQITALDMAPLGYLRATSNPFQDGSNKSGLGNINFGSNISASYKSFDMTLGFQGGALQTYLIEWELRNPLQGGANSSERLLKNSWHMQDIFNPSDDSWVPGKYPAIRDNQASHSNSKSNTFYSRNVKYIRLKNLDFGYSLPKKFIGRVGMDRCRIYANVFNVFSIDNVREFGIDPEISTTSGLQYPSNRIINFGANVTF